MKDPHARIHGFSKAVQTEIEHRLNTSDSLRSVAHWIQHEKRLATDVAEATLIQNLKRYREHLVAARPKVQIVRPEVVKEDQMVLPDSHVDSFLPDDVDEIDELDVMHAAIRYQAARVDMHKALEHKYMRPTKRGSDDLELLSRMCVRSHDIRMDRGKVNSDATSLRPELRPQIRETYGEELAETMDGPESSAKVLSLFHQLKKRAANLRDDGNDSAEVGESSTSA